VKLLLDTHALIWAVQSPDRLSERARGALTAADAEVFASHVSLWEMAIKRSLGKLDQLDRTAADWFDHFVPRSGLRQLPITARHLGAVEHLPRLHHDPFDRLLVSQARHDGMALVSLDSHVAQYDVDVVW
jgi:PIN domain nuclease of toxin-antitoxin system